MSSLLSISWEPQEEGTWHSRRDPVLSCSPHSDLFMQGSLAFPQNRGHQEAKPTLLVPQGTPRA